MDEGYGAEDMRARSGGHEDSAQGRRRAEDGGEVRFKVWWWARLVGDGGGGGPCCVVCGVLGVLGVLESGGLLMMELGGGGERERGGEVVVGGVLRKDTCGHTKRPVGYDDYGVCSC